MDFAAYENWNRDVGDPGKRRIQEGLDAAIARLDAMGVIDSSRVGLTGLSYGGETVMYALFHMPRLGAAIASGTEFGPASTFLYGVTEHDLLQRWDLERWGSPRWDTLSIIRNAERVYAPLLLNVADHEMLDAMHPYTALEQAGRAVEIYVFPREHHIKSGPAHRLAIYQRNIDWMNFWTLIPPRRPSLDASIRCATDSADSSPAPTLLRTAFVGPRTHVHLGC